MAGFRTFATGEVLTAANVNDFLMKQSVMVFADAAARTVALGAEVTEGMLTYNLDTDQLEVFDGSAFVLAAPEPPAGVGSNVVQTVKTTTFTTSSTSFTAVTGLAVTITPTSDTAKILVIVDLAMTPAGGVGDERPQARLVRGGTAIYVGDAEGSRTQALLSVVSAGTSGATSFATQGAVFRFGATFLDSPATGAATTYSLEGRTTAGTMFVNRNSTDANNSGFVRTASSITAIEVAA